MICQLKCISVSILLHLAMICLAFTFAGKFFSEPKPVVIDLTLTTSKGSSLQGTETGNKKSTGGASGGKVSETRVKKNRNTAKRNIQELPVPSETINATAKTVTAEIAEVPRKVQAIKKTENVVLSALASETAHDGNGTVNGASAFRRIIAGMGSEMGLGMGTGNAGGGETGSGKSQGGSGQGNGDSTGQMRKRYLSEQFEYIKNLIEKNLVYPPRAKRMGWSGKVAVSFTIQENGRVTNVNIIHSSGYELLDDNVIETIKKVQPFPKPPVSAVLKIPFTYRLEY